MRRLALLSVLTLAAAPALADAPPAHSDGQPNRYRLEIDATARRATVEASLWLSGNLLSMFNVAPVPGLPNGTADLIEALEVEGADGALLPVESLGQGDFELPRGGRVKVRYRVRLEHDRYAWPAGAEEVAYPTDEGWMATGATLLLADGGDAIVGPIEVAVALPAGWRAVTPWSVSLRAASSSRFCSAVATEARPLSSPTCCARNWRPTASSLAPTRRPAASWSWSTRARVAMAARSRRASASSSPAMPTRRAA